MRSVCETQCEDGWDGEGKSVVNHYPSAVCVLLGSVAWKMGKNCHSQSMCTVSSIDNRSANVRNWESTVKSSLEIESIGGFGNSWILLLVTPSTPPTRNESTFPTSHKLNSLPKIETSQKPKPESKPPSNDKTPCIDSCSTESCCVDNIIIKLNINSVASALVATCIQTI